MDTVDNDTAWARFASLDPFNSSKRMCIERRQLTSLPGYTSRVANLKTLILGQNSFIEIPNVIYYLEQLTYLEIDNNQLRSIPGWISRCTGLETLSATRNQIRIIHALIYKLTNLKILDLNYNQITLLPKTFGTGLFRLESLSLEHN